MAFQNTPRYFEWVLVSTIFDLIYWQSENAFKYAAENF